MRPPIVPVARRPLFWRETVRDEAGPRPLSVFCIVCMGPEPGATFCPCQMLDHGLKVVIVEDQPWRTPPQSETT